MYTHQQRFPDDYPDGLKLPHVLHLAELATEYALPHEYKILDDDIEGRGRRRRTRCGWRGRRGMRS